MSSNLSQYSKEEVVIKLHDDCELTIFSNSDDSLLELANNEAIDSGEEKIQLKEGYSYDYELSNQNWQLDKISKIVKPLKGSKNNRGTITPGNYVGRLELTAISGNENKETIGIEIRSTKVGYREEYRTMLEDITDECVELLMQHTSPVTKTVSVDYEDSSKTPYQKFAFIKSIIDSDEFCNAVHRVISMPVTAWKEAVEDKDIRRAGRINSNHIRQIVSSRGNRIKLPNSHPLHSRIPKVPAQI